VSLLADILSKVKQQEKQGKIPPNLAQIILESKKTRRTQKRLVVLSVGFVLLVAIGFGALYVIDVYLKVPSLLVDTPKKQLPATVEKTSVTPPPQSETRTEVKQLMQETQTEPQIRTKIPLPKTVKQAGRQTAGKGTEKKQETVVVAQEIQQPRTISVPTQEERNNRDVYIYSAKTFENNKDYQQAILQYQKALRIDPSSYLILNNLASVYLKAGSFEESMVYAKRALEIKKNYVPALINLGIAYIQGGQTKEGEEYLLKAMVVEPSNRHVLLNLALLYEKLRIYEKANSFFHRLSKIGDIEGLLGMARIFEKQGKREEAEGVYRQILSMNNLGQDTKKLVNERLSILGSR